MEFYIRNGGSWRKADPAKGIYVYNSGWKEASEIWIRDGGAWRQGYQKSDPVTYTMPLNSYLNSYASRFARGTSWGISTNGPGSGTSGTRNIACGRYYTGGNTKRYYGLMEFLFADGSDGYGVELLSVKLGRRPVVQSATLRLTRDTVIHGYSNPSSGNIYVSPYNGSTSDSAPDPADVDFSKAASKSAVGLTRGSDITIDLDQDIIDELASTGNLALTNVNSGLNNLGSSLDQTYLWFFGTHNVADTSKHPLITVTLDYA